MSKKYHEEHPTISFRCKSIDQYKMIKKAVERSGKSESDFVLEIALGAAEKESKSFLNGLNYLAWICPVCKELKVCQVTKIFEEQSFAKFLQNHLREYLCHPESYIELYQSE